MKRRIWKYPLEITDTQNLMMPEGAEILAAQMQGDTLCLWALVNPDAPKQRREIEVLGTGNPAPDAKRRIGSVMRFPRGSHSSKPDQVRDWIAKWYPNERKLEMFARPYTEMWPKHDGWETWGNELTNDVAMTPNARLEPQTPETTNQKH